MLPDDGHRVHREFAAAKPQRFGHGGEDADAVLLGLFPGHVIHRELVDVECGHVKARRVPLVIQPVPVQKAAYRDVGMGIGNHTFRMQATRSFGRAANIAPGAKRRRSRRLSQRRLIP